MTTYFLYRMSFFFYSYTFRLCSNLEFCKCLNPSILKKGTVSEYKNYQCSLIFVCKWAEKAEQNLNVNFVNNKNKLHLLN